MTTIYHHTSLAHLPFIAQSEVLLLERLTGMAHLRANACVWATEDPKGDRTAAVCRQRKVPRVRIRFDTDDPDNSFKPFSYWLEQAPEEMGMLQRLAAHMGQPSTKGWWASPEVVPLSRCLDITARTWTGGWVTVEPPLKMQLLDPGEYAFEALGRLWHSKHGVHHTGQYVYLCDEIKAGKGERIQ